jgi:hypothetical protein
MDGFRRWSMTNLQTEHTFLIGCAAGPEDAESGKSSRHPALSSRTD